jgi:hypothetical protein
MRIRIQLRVAVRDLSMRDTGERFEESAGQRERSCPGSVLCITNEYMVASAVMTLRIDPALLTALRQRAKREGRSVSAEVVRLIRKELEDVHVPARRGRGTRSTMGMFANSEAPDLDDFKRVRREASALIARRVRRSRHSA